MLIVVLLAISLILAVVFPKYLIQAIREQDAEKSDSYQMKACISFGIIVLSIFLAGAIR